MHLFATGFFTGLGLIVAIGAQNAWIMRQGIRREYVGIVVSLCIVSDIALIAVGTLSVGALGQGAPWILEILKWGGVAYLLWFAFSSFRSAMKGNAGLKSQEAPSARSVVATTLALTFLNPHVYLDTVIMLGTLANSFGPQRWLVSGGAMVGSALWFTLLGFAARALSGPLNRPSTWKWLDICVGVIMLFVAWMLATS
ncbi:MAG: LysE/ArgO family amino acid transporter [Actinomycetaceae bacterium]|nr:LysE/ArgO family amino acid transporter [Actinomycetaceae bacterium]